MQFFTRLLMIAVLAAFAASSIAYAAGSAKMASEMIDAGAEMTGAADNESCADDAAGTFGIACDLVCSAPAVALMETSTDGGPFAVSSVYVMLVERNFRGLSSPPARQPPRPLL